MAFRCFLAMAFVALEAFGSSAWVQVDPALQKNVDFWVKVYSELGNRQGVVHDAKYVDLVYEVVDFSKGSGSGFQQTKAAKKKWKQVLLSLHRKGLEVRDSDDLKDLTSDEKKVVGLFKEIHEPNKFLNAAHRKRLRFQLGQKESFLEGLRQSGRYLKEMERIFQEENLPVELTRLPFVESSFNLKARSKVGASGIWQFMKSTARLFIRVDDAADERNDPLSATRAAAQLFKLNYQSLENWELAVTAYNHGRKSLMRAVRLTGENRVSGLMVQNRSRSFGFASSNFFAGLLAAIEVEKNADRYFQKVDRDPALQFVELKLPDFVPYPVFAKYLSLIDEKAVKELNPGLNSEVWEGHLYVPLGYSFRIPCPEGVSQSERLAFLKAKYSEIPSLNKQKAQRRSKL